MSHQSRIIELENRVAELEALLAAGSSTSSSLEAPPEDLPGFASYLRSSSTHRLLKLREWEDMEWRREQGWIGKDLCHNPSGRGVRVLEYYWEEISQSLTGIVWFGPDAESHRGLCHGGAMTSLLDDICGHYVFACASQGQQPWSGCTVQVNCALKRPVHIGSILRVVASGSFTESKNGKKKCKVSAVLDAPASTASTMEPGLRSEQQTIVYAELDGISICDIRITADEAHKTDAVGSRVWIDVDSDEGGGGARMDSGWSMG